MRSMFYTGKTENQLVFEEKIHFRGKTFECSIENRVILVIQYLYTLCCNEREEADG